MTANLSPAKKLKGSLSDIVPGFLFALLIAQPVLDVISFWANEWDFTVITTLTRFGMFAMVLLYGFIISDKKKLYFAAAAVLAAYWVLHVIGCVKSESGYISPFSDANNYFRTIHMPLFTMAFITMFKKSDKVPVYVQKAFCVNMIIMMHSLVLSYITGTQIYTYGMSGKGLMGWASVHNSQSAILAFIIPLMLLYAYSKRNKVMYYVVAVVCFINLFFVGTKVDYFSIFIIALGMMILLVISGEKNLYYYSILFLVALLCALCYNQSIAFDVKISHESSMSQKQDYLDVALKDPPTATPNDGSEENVPLGDHISWETFETLSPLKQYEIRKIYQTYLGPMVQRFGFERVFEKYNYSLVVKELTATRQAKVHFAEMVFEDSNLMTKLFGYEYCMLLEDYTFVNSSGREVTQQYIFDLENDFPSVFYYSGYVGFAIYVLFLLYFVGLILVAVITRFKKCVNLENGLLAITFALMLGTSQWSGNVLRRPNASVYMSVILAYIYYVTVIKENVKFRDLFSVFKKKKKA